LLSAVDRLKPKVNEDGMGEEGGDDGGLSVSDHANTIRTVGATMPPVNLSFEHGQSYDTARRNFEKGITHARAKFGMFIRTVVWSDDRTSATLTGTGFEVNLRLDETMVHATGRVPIFPRFLEGPVRKFLAETFKDGGKGTVGGLPKDDS
jgi:hypothetical protein